MTGGGHVGFIGFGAMARDAWGVLTDHASTPRLTVLLRPGSPSRAAVPPEAAVVESMADLILARPDLVVEAAGQPIVATLLPEALAAGIPALVASTGAFAEPGLLARLSSLARSHGTELLLSAGAVAGLDYLDVVALCTGTRVQYTSRKPPAAWRQELAALGIDPDSLTDEVVLFEGSSEDAARRFPRNLNVALTLQLRLGSAADAMRVRVVADPRVDVNTHEIEVVSALGTASLRFGNLASTTNPKTSALAGHTLAAEIRKAVRTNRDRA